MRRARFALAIALAVAFAGAARADNAAQRRAAESFRQAQAAFERRDFAAAAAAFEQAATFDPHPAPLLNAADAWERADEPAHAADDCERALTMPNVTDAYSSEAEKCLQRLAPKLATLDFRGPSTIAVRIDGGAPLIVPVRRRVAPGHHAIAVVDLGTSQTRVTELDVHAGEARALDVALDTAPSTASAPPEPAPARSPAPPTEHARGSVPTSAWVAFGVGGAAAVVATTFSLFTFAAKNSFDGGDNTQAAADTFHRDKAIANVAWGVTGVAVATGLVLWIAAPRAGSPSVSLAPTSYGAGLAGTVRFQ